MTGRRAILLEVDGVEAGAVSIRFPWLKGPYLELLALLPPFQRQGIGAGILTWFEQRGVSTRRAQSLGVRLVLQRRCIALL